MSLVDFQKILLTLYTDESFLDSFISSREGIFAKYTLTSREKDAINSIAEEKIKTFSKELGHKRILVARKIFKKAGYENAPVLLFPVHRHGPVLFFLNKGRETEILLSERLRALFSEIAKKYTVLSYSTVVSAASSLLVNVKTGTLADEPTLSDLIRAMGIIRRYRLQGKLIRRTL